MVDTNTRNRNIFPSGVFYIFLRNWEAREVGEFFVGWFEVGNFLNWKNVSNKSSHRFFQLWSELSNFSILLTTLCNQCKPIFCWKALSGHIDVGDQCWRQNVSVTSFKCWWQNRPFWNIGDTKNWKNLSIFKNCHQLQVVDITLSPTSLWP